MSRQISKSRHADSLNPIRPTLEDIVAWFRRDYQKAKSDDLHFYALQNHATLIKYAAESLKPNGKRDSHQARLDQAVLEQAKERLLPADFSVCRNFDELLDLVDEMTRDLKGIGDLTVYDIATRIGAKYGLEPEKVYLHAGARGGARALGLDRSQRYLEMSELPAPLRTLKPSEVEDLLCIYKDELGRLRSE